MNDPYGVYELDRRYYLLPSDIFFSLIFFFFLTNKRNFFLVLSSFSQFLLVKFIYYLFTWMDNTQRQFKNASVTPFLLQLLQL